MRADRRVLSRAAVPLILVAHLVGVTWLSASLNLWVDETYSLHTTSGDLLFAVRQAVSFEEQPPFYFVALWAWRLLNDSLFWARMFSAACVLGFLIIAWRVVVRMFPQIHPAWIIGPMAANPALIYAATEVRVPALSVLLSAVLVWLFLEGFWTETPRRWAVWAYGFVSIAALYTYYYLGFLLLANGIAVLLTQRWRAAAQYYAMMIAVALSYIPMFMAMPGQEGAFTSRSAFSLTFSGGLRLMIERIQGYVWPSVGLPLPGVRRWIVPGLLMIAVALTLAIHRKQLGRPFAILCTILGVTGFSLALVAWQLGWRSMLPRHALPVLLPAYLCLYAMIALYREPARRGVLVGWTAAVAVTTIVALHATYRPMAKAGDWERVARYVETHARANEPILVFPADNYKSFMHHYRGKNPVLPIPRMDSYTRYNHPDDMLRHDYEIVAALDTVPQRTRSMWVVVSCDLAECGYMGVNNNLDVLDRFLTANYSIDKTRTFFGTRLQHCSRPDRVADVKLGGQ